MEPEAILPKDISGIIKHARLIFPINEYGWQQLMFDQDATIQAVEESEKEEKKDLVLALKAKRHFINERDIKFDRKNGSLKYSVFHTSQTLGYKPDISGNGRYVPGWECFEASTYIMKKIKEVGYSAAVTSLKVKEKIYTDDYAVKVWNSTPDFTFCKYLSITPFMGDENGIIDPAIILSDDMGPDKRVLEIFESRANFRPTITTYPNTVPFSIEIIEGINIWNTFSIIFPLGKYLGVFLKTEAMINGELTKPIESIFNCPIQIVADIAGRSPRGDPQKLFEGEGVWQEFNFGNVFLDKAIEEHHKKTLVSIVTRVFQILDKEVIKMLECQTGHSTNEVENLFNKGACFCEMGRFEVAIRIFDEVVRRYEDTDQVNIAKWVVMAIFSKGKIFSEMGQFEDAIKACEVVQRLYGERKETEIVAQVAKALLNKGVILGHIERFEEEIKEYEEVVRRYGGREETEIAETVAWALLNKGVSLDQIERFEDAIKACEVVQRLYGERKETEIVSQVAKALLNKGVSLGHIERFEEEIKEYEEVVRRYGGREETEIAEAVAMAFMNKAYRLEQLKRFSEAVKLCEEFIKHYGGRKEAGIAERVVNAIYLKKKLGG